MWISPLYPILEIDKIKLKIKHNFKHKKLKTINMEDLWRINI